MSAILLEESSVVARTFQNEHNQRYRKALANKSKSDLAGAIAAGVCAGVVESFIHALYRELSISGCVSWITLGITAYFIVGIFVQIFWREQIVPGWILTAFIGSMLFLAALLAPGVIKGWYDPYRIQQSLMDYLQTEIDAATSGLDLLYLVSFPIMASFHYAHEIINALKEWHAGSEPISIRHDE